MSDPCCEGFPAQPSSPGHCFLDGRAAVSSFPTSDGVWKGRGSVQVVGVNFPACWRRDSSRGRIWAEEGYYGRERQGWKDGRTLQRKTTWQ